MNFSEWAIIRGRELGLATDDPTHAPAYMATEAAAKNGTLDDGTVNRWATLLQVTPEEIRRRASLS